MTKAPQPTMRLLGGLCSGGADWDTAEFTGLFERLGAIEGSTAAYQRYLGYSGEADGNTEVRFFGVAVDSIDVVPPGLVGIELSEGTLAVIGPSFPAPTVPWHGHVNWNWLDRTPETAAVGEFTAHVPNDWLSRATSPVLEFILSANAYFRRGGVLDDNVNLVSYDPSWPVLFEQMADSICKTFPPEIVLRVEHYGSTAIPGMPAKPIIDILIEVPSFAKARLTLIPALNRPDCEYWWYNDHMLFILRSEPMGKRMYHLHVAPGGHSLWDGIAFRDYLRLNPVEAKRYAALKHELAEHYPGDREVYTKRKEGFVHRVTAKALRSRQ